MRMTALVVSLLGEEGCERRVGCSGVAGKVVDGFDACWEAVRKTLATVPWVAAPRQVRWPLHTWRLTTAGRMACSQRQLVASTPGESDKPSRQTVAGCKEVL